MYTSKSKKINSIIQDNATLMLELPNHRGAVIAYRTYVNTYDYGSGTWCPELCIAIKTSGTGVIEYTPEDAEERIRKYADLRKWVIEY